jgi:hypothetical protein
VAAMNNDPLIAHEVQPTQTVAAMVRADERTASLFRWPSAETNATNPWALSHSLVAWMTLALLWLCAGCFLLRMRKNPELARAAAIDGLATGGNRCGT